MGMPEPPDSHFLSAAVGWYELGNIAEAREELERISANSREHPNVLEVEWLLLSKCEEWDVAVSVARRLMEVAPDRASGWLHLSYALRRAKGGGLEASWNALRPAYEKFPTEPVVPYNLACYACLMNRLDEAREWLGRALKIEDKRRIKEMALADEDLEPLWDEIRKL